MEQITIVGAGIGGLTAALVLRRAGYSVTVLERGGRVAPVGAGIVLAPNAVAILESLGVDLRSCGYKSSKMTIRTSSGAILQSLDLDRLLRGFGPALAFHRGELHQALLAALPRDVSLQFHCSPVNCSAFDQGLLIGADGIHSAVREQTLGEVPIRYSGMTCWRAVLPNHAITEGFEAWGGPARVGVVPLTRNRIYVFLVLSAPRGIPRQTSIGAIRESFHHFSPPVPNILDALEGRELLHHDIEELGTPVWGRGRVVLIGDAAHAMTPNLGQGAAMAIEDAAVLPKVVASADPVQTIQSLRNARVSRIQRDSRNFGQAAHWRSPFATWLRNTLIAGTPEILSDRYYRRLIGPGLALLDSSSRPDIGKMNRP